MITPAPIRTRLSRRPTAWDLLPKDERQVILDLCSTVLSIRASQSDWRAHRDSRPAPGLVQLGLAKFTPAYLRREPLEWDDIHVLKDFLACRTAYVDGYALECDYCKKASGVPASCRRRGCARCGGLKRELWKALHVAELINGAYYHMVFTLPRKLRKLARWNPETVLDEFMKAAYKAVQSMGLEMIGAEVGGTVVLQTWGGGLAYVPHVHVFMPAGGIALDTGKWIAWGKEEIPQERELGQCFRELFVESLEVAFRKKSPILGRELAHLSAPRQMEDFLENVAATEGLVWYKRFEEGGEPIAEYLADHINGRPLSDADIVEIDDKRVTLRASSHRLGGVPPVRLGGAEFVKEYLSHRLPKGFVAVRSFGCLVSHKKAETIAAIKGRSVLQTREDLRRQRKEIEKKTRMLLQERYGRVSSLCDDCGVGRLRLRRVEEMPRTDAVVLSVAHLSHRLRLDSS